MSLLVFCSGCQIASRIAGVRSDLCRDKKVDNPDDNNERPPAIIILGVACEPSRSRTINGRNHKPTRFCRPLLRCLAPLSSVKQIGLAQAVSRPSKGRLTSITGVDILAGKFRTLDSRHNSVIWDMNLYSQSLSLPPTSWIAVRISAKF
jgi:hypothetical protein